MTQGSAVWILTVAELSFGIKLTFDLYGTHNERPQVAGNQKVSSSETLCKILTHLKEIKGLN